MTSIWPWSLLISMYYISLQKYVWDVNFFFGSDPTCKTVRIIADVNMQTLRGVEVFFRFKSSSFHSPMNVPALGLRTSFLLRELKFIERFTTSNKLKWLIPTLYQGWLLHENRWDFVIVWCIMRSLCGERFQYVFTILCAKYFIVFVL